MGSKQSMPILDVEVVVDNEESLAGDLAGRIAEAAGEVFGTPPHRTWVRLRTLATKHYAENGGGPVPGVRPVFVSVLKATLPGTDALNDEIRKLTGAIAEACNRPIENVHVLYLPEASGRVAFGGTMVGRPGHEP